MSTVLNVNYDKKPCYDIIINDSFEGLLEKVEELGFKGRKIAIITDTNVKPLYSNEILNILTPASDKIVVYAIPAGEENKNLSEIEKIYEVLIENHFDRHDLIVALGGGVVGDMAGFTAATYLRGISFIQIPTTLLAQTDSSIGGKTGVDFNGYKNMVGAFHMPRLVYMNLSCLGSLDAREYSSGMAEILKHGLIKDNKYYEWLINHFQEINERDPDTLVHMIKRSCEIKRDVVEADPTEQGERALLNFGHTIGHAIEKYMDLKLRHGECVALGSVAASFISYRRGYLSTEEYYEIRDMFVPFGLPITLPDDADAEKILKLTKSDKKMNGAQIRFILLKACGRAYIDTSVTDEEILSGIKELILTED